MWRMTGVRVALPVTRTRRLPRFRIHTQLRDQAENRCKPKDLRGHSRLVCLMHLGSMQQAAIHRRDQTRDESMIHPAMANNQGVFVRPPRPTATCSAYKLITESATLWLPIRPEGKAFVRVALAFSTYRYILPVCFPFLLPSQSETAQIHVTTFKFRPY